MSSIHCRPVKKAAIAWTHLLAGRPPPLEQELPALPDFHPADLGDGTHLSTASESAASQRRSPAAEREGDLRCSEGHASHGTTVEPRPSTLIRSL